jgi:hypothetical protein
MTCLQRSLFLLQLVRARKCGELGIREDSAGSLAGRKRFAFSLHGRYGEVFFQLIPKSSQRPRALYAQNRDKCLACSDNESGIP